MAITHAAKKAVRKTKRQTIANLKKGRKLKSLLKKVGNLISLKKTEEAKKLLPQVYKVLDKAVKANLIKKNKASRKKSRITKAILKLAKK